MESDQDDCPYGLSCRYLRSKTCSNHHPWWHFDNANTNNQDTHTSNRNECFNGPECWYFKQGRCKFYHPEKNNFFRRNVYEVSRRQEKHIEQRKKKLQEIQRKRREREQAQAQIRRLQALRISELINASRQKPPKKSNSQTFEWYFSKNKTFKAMDVSEEKLEQLEQCIICYACFAGENVEKKEEEVENNSEKAQKEQNGQKEQKEPAIKKEQGLKMEQKVEKIKQFLTRQLTELYCGHTFHKECIKKWLSTNESCPICRKDFKDHKEYNKWEEERKKLKPLRSVFWYPEEEIPRVVLQQNSSEGMLYRAFVLSQQSYQNWDNSEEDDGEDQDYEEAEFEDFDADIYNEYEEYNHEDDWDGYGDDDY